MGTDQPNHKTYNLVAKHFIVNSEKEVIKLYGDPEALRWLAGELIKMADCKNKTEPGFKFPPEDEGEVCHFLPAGRGTGLSVLHETSTQLDIGRLDCRKDGTFDWFIS